MAKSKHNEVMQGASGRIGNNLVFRQRGNQTIIAKRPRKTSGTRTQKQIEVQNRFLDASLYAKSVIQDEQLKAIYQSRATVNQSAYNVAIKDYCRPPEIRKLDDDKYKGEVGDTFTLMVRDVLQVQELQVEILDLDGDLIESGQAVPDTSFTYWTYTAAEPNPDYETSSYKITMLDTPGHVTVETLEYGEKYSL